MPEANNEADDFYLGDSRCRPPDRPVQGGYVLRGGEPYYRISHYDQIEPFFMTVVSGSDHWLFLSSNGGLTAGRKNPAGALFPYVSEDKIHDAADSTGSQTILFVERKGRQWLWEPLSFSNAGVYDVERHLYKNVLGNKLVFEEVNHTLAVCFFHAWYTSDRFGFVRHAGIRNLSADSARIRIVDGLRNLLPAGVDPRMQTVFSNLVDAYKRHELLPDTGLALYTLSSIPVDRPQPSESLSATTVWSTGLERPTRLLSSRQLERVRRRFSLEEETDVRGTRGAYYVHADFHLEPGAEKQWYLVADVNQDAADVVAVNNLLKRNEDLASLLHDDVKLGSERLLSLVGGADGLQRTEERLNCGRHFSNVLFNIMRGGTFLQAGLVERSDLRAFLTTANALLAARHVKSLEGLPATFRWSQGLALVAECGDPQLERLYCEYLPLTFSRRHGDPSRPWNQFSIETRNEDGSQNLDYQGNWRDIFQNWEALCISFPSYVRAAIFKFVNATTVDGYNPYRVTRDGFEWETANASQAWSGIGYWGDHQIIYLLKFLELSSRFHPGELRHLIAREVFASANVPYRIKSYEDLLRDPHHSIVVDDAAQRQVEQRVAAVGSDGKLVWDRAGNVYLVSLAEKLLVLLLAKLANFIPEAGIWMNTQRPEWNDANNALTGRGISMVTLYYLRRYLVFCADLFGKAERDACRLSREVADWYFETKAALEDQRYTLAGRFSPAQRRTLLDRLGSAASGYRTRIYERGFTGEKVEITAGDVARFLHLALSYVDHAIAANKRDDGLYHAYNVMVLEADGGISIRRLCEMLEGQVAVLSSGCLTAEEALELLAALRSSSLFRQDQYSYLLYPERRLPRFLEKNRIPRKAIEASALLRDLIARGDRRLVLQDEDGVCHFQAGMRNAADAKSALERIAAEHPGVWSQEDFRQVLDIYESVFDHQSFTGRSGAFFGYEGLGCVYWHMVSKLLLAILEVYESARSAGAAEETLVRLIDCYYDVRAGLGAAKPPHVYGAFPTDPYSHTPAGGGAKQPGMTGQVKEDIITRMGELGVRIEASRIILEPTLLKKTEFLGEPSDFEYYDTTGTRQRVELDAHSLAFTYCQVPVVYRLSDRRLTRVHRLDGSTVDSEEVALDRHTSGSIFDRRGEIRMIEAWRGPCLD